ncbi:TPA: fructokinase [Pasteurella multocida]|uniref:fructokinase n=1 Tax=Pasteurella multocida TaxID=747 RepID=UPI0003439CA2|nr:fructokinase [Pasteurella multocida]AWW60386.1 fructokinase [Pasteurellaceae bacterium 12591]AHE64993.1 fructokinase [Pasteurella multocida subsp. multocida str. HB03]AIN49343.1 glucokinase family protein [Pasteurella multocida]ANJ90802.1 fructokinase [Pasteurella multocida subsp. multocida HB01]AON59075.1 fructokinase [Pasteurella multocida]
MRIGIDLGGTKIEVIALSNEGKELFRKRVPTPRGSYEATLAAIKGLVDDAEQATGQTGTVGIGIPGTISPFSHKVKNANSVWLNGQPLDKDLCRLLGREVRIANDANCMTVSEATDGAGAGSAVVLALILGTGCGSGIVIHGKPHHGGNGIGGEWGHNPLPWMDDEEKAVAQQTPCYCGKHGCIEQFVSGTGLCDDYERRSGKRLKGDEILALAEQGDTLAEQSFQAYERRLAKALSSYVNMLDPDVIVFAGGVCNVDRLYTNVPKLMPQYIFGHEFHTPIRKALHGDSSGVRGAAWLWPLEK